MTERVKTAFTVVLSHPVEMDATDVATILGRFWETAQDVDGVLPEGAPLILARCPTPHDARLFHEQAVRQGLEMYDDETTVAIRAYVEQHSDIPEHAHEVEGYGELGYDPARLLHERYNLSEEMLGVDALEDAACIIESGLFDEHKGSLDRGTWQKSDDPIQSVKNMADDLYQRVVVATVEKCFLAFVAAYRAEPDLEAALTMGLQVVNAEYLG